MPSYRHHEMGDLFVRLNVAFPEHIDPALIPHLEQALPPRRELQKFPPTIHLEEVDLGELDARQQKTASRQDNDMDDDEEGGEPRVQCANQ